MPDGTFFIQNPNELPISEDLVKLCQFKPLPRRTSLSTSNNDLNQKRPSTKPIIIEEKKAEKITKKVKQSLKPEETQIKKTEQDIGPKPILNPLEIYNDS
jgi:hypothetical protein